MQQFFSGANVENAVGLLKEEMRRLDSLIMRAADATAVPAGGALAVDRNAFFCHGGRNIGWQREKFILIREEITEIPQDAITIIANISPYFGKIFDCFGKFSW